MSTLTDSEKLIYLAKFLYTRDVFKEFRRPVIAAYPSLAKNYLSIVRNPMDLGTLLYECLKNEINKEEFCQKVELIVNNALEFNKGYTSIESISHHLLWVSKSLFAELFEENWLNSSSNQSFDAMNQSIKQSKRYQFIQDYELTAEECNQLLFLLKHSTIVNLFPSETVSPLIKSLVSGSNPQQSHKNTLKQLFTTLIESIPSSEDSQLPDIPLLKVYFPTIQIASDFVEFWQQINVIASIFAVMVEERRSRGFTASTSWSIPSSTCVWSQISKDSRNRVTWWPAMILLSNSSSYPIPADFAAINYTRFSKDIIKELIKIKPRLPSNNNNGSDDPSQLYVPEGYLILEYFGEHDVGWSKAENVMPMDPNGVIPTGIGKTCNNEIFQEAEETRQLLLACSSSSPSASYEQTSLDLKDIPSLDVLEESITIDEVILAEVNKLKRKFEDSENKSNQNSARKKASTNPTNVNEAGPSQIKSKRTQNKSKKEELIDIHGNNLLDIHTPSKLKPKDFKQNLERLLTNGKLLISKCPLPPKVLNDVPVPGFHTKNGLNIRRNAMIRTHLYAQYLQLQKPIKFIDDSLTNANNTSLTTPNNNNNTHNTPSDRKHNPNNNLNDMFLTSNTSDNPSDWGNQLLSPQEDLDFMNRPVLIQEEGLYNGSLLEIGCSRYAMGEGLIYSRSIDLTATIFFKESKCLATRKAYLLDDIHKIKTNVEKLAELTKKKTTKVTTSLAKELPLKRKGQK